MKAISVLAQSLLFTVVGVVPHPHPRSPCRKKEPYIPTVGSACAMGVRVRGGCTRRPCSVTSLLSTLVGQGQGPQTEGEETPLACSGFHLHGDQDMQLGPQSSSGI